MKKIITLICILTCGVYFYLSNPSSGPVTSSQLSNTISGDQYHSFVIRENGELVSWGDNQWGALGQQFSEYPDSPANAAKVMDNTVFISTTELWSLAVDKEGGLWAWGIEIMYNTFDNYKDKGYGHNSPAKIMDDAVMVSAGRTILVVKKDRSLWGWGEYVYGNLGDGRYNKYMVEGVGARPETPAIYTDIEKNPVKIMDNVIYTLSDTAQYAIKSDNSLWAWGYNENGELGDGTTKTQIYPVKIMDDVVFIAPGPYAIKTDGSLWTWGINEDDGKNITLEGDPLLPQKIMDNVVFASKFSGGQHIVIQKDGSLWEWGDNRFGQLGDGTIENSNVPVKIMDNAIYAAGNTFSTLVLKKDGSLWHMGLYNDAYGKQIYLPHKVMDDIMLPQPLWTQ